MTRLVLVLALSACSPVACLSGASLDPGGGESVTPTVCIRSVDHD